MRKNKLCCALSIFAVLFCFSITFAAVPVEVTVGKETVLKLNKPIKSIDRVSLANEEIAEIKPLIATSPNEVEIIINGKNPGVTSLIVWHAEGKTFFDVIVLEKIDTDMTYGSKMESLMSEIRAVAPTDDIRVSLANDTIVLSGYASNQQTINKAVQIAQAYAIASEVMTTTKYSAGLTTTETSTTGKVLNHIQIKEAQQVSLEVRVAQINKTKMKELGVGVLFKGSSAEGTFPGLIQGVSPTGVLGEGTTFSDSSIDSSISANESVTTTTFDNILGQLTADTMSTAAGGTALTERITEKTRDSGIEGYDLDLLSAPQIGISHFASGVTLYLRALSSKGLAKILAEPDLIVKSGDRGNFHVGVRVPVQVVYGVGANATPSITYEQVGVRLNFAPEVLENGVIRLKIDPAEVSGITRYISMTGGGLAPEINTRRVETTVDLKEGESLVLAGLLSEDMKKNMKKIPLLGDIPILGALFRSTDEELEQTELAFFITPKLVTPIPAGEETERVKSELPGVNSPTPEEERELQWIPLPSGSSKSSSESKEGE